MLEGIRYAVKAPVELVAEVRFMATSSDVLLYSVGVMFEDGGLHLSGPFDGALEKAFGIIVLSGGLTRLGIVFPIRRQW